MLPQVIGIGNPLVKMDYNIQPSHHKHSPPVNAALGHALRHTKLDGMYDLNLGRAGRTYRTWGGTVDSSPSLVARAFPPTISRAVRISLRGAFYPSITLLVLCRFPAGI